MNPPVLNTFSTYQMPVYLGDKILHKMLET